MKRIGNIFDQIISIENLQLADAKARIGKLQSKGVQIHDRNREQNILSLHEQLKNKTFQPSQYTTFTIHEPKERLISRLPYFPDRILHHAIMNVIEPIIVKTCNANTFACFKDRGINGKFGCNKAVKRILKRHETDENLYCLKIDIRKFYPSIDHDTLKSIIRRKIKDTNVLWLLDTIIDSTDGLPIGNYTSQYFSNFYLAYFDHFVKEELKLDYCRYADDMIFISPSKAELWQKWTAIKAYIHSLKIEIKDNWQLFKIANDRTDKGRGIDFVGYVFYRRATYIRKSIKQNFARRTAQLNKRNIPADEYKQQISSWIGWCKYADAKNLTKSLISKKYYNEITGK